METRARSAARRPAAATVTSVRNESVAIQQQRAARLAAGAANQWGNVTTEQLRRLGYSREQIRGMRERRVLHRRHRGVYAYGHVSPAPESKWAAALLAAGPGSALSGTAVLAAHRLLEPRYVTEVTAPTKRRGDERLRIHLGDPGEIVLVRGLRCTTIPRALVDVAATGWPIDRLAHEAAASGLASLDDLRTYANATTRKGVQALRAALALPHTRSRGEERMLAYLERRGLPVPEMNVRLDGMTVDGYVEELGLVIELDHPETHGSAFARRRDANRDARHRAQGRDVIRLEENDLAALADEIAARL